MPWDDGSKHFGTCPLCGQTIRRSDHLNDVFNDKPYAEWIANLVTHYRHDHTKSWDLTITSSRYAAKNIEFQKLGYDAYKAKVNNRAKRQLMRGLSDSPFTNTEVLGLLLAVKHLQQNDQATMDLRGQLLSQHRPEVSLDTFL